MKPTTVRIVVFLAVLFAVGSVYVALSRRADDTQPPAAQPSDSTSATTTPSVVDGSSTTILPIDGSGVEYSDVVTIPDVPVPNLKRAPVFGPFATAAVQERSGKRIAELQTLLSADPYVFDNWIELGLQFASAGDHAAAADMYQYAALLRPESSLPFANLGFVYGWHLKQPVKAEAAYRKAIENDATLQYIQIQLFELYRDVFNDPAKAKAFAEERIEASPEFALDFKRLIAELGR